MAILATGAIDSPMLGSILNRVRAQAAADPLSNPILLFALDLTLRMDRGEIDLDGLERIVQQLTAEAFADRADAAEELPGRDRDRGERSSDARSNREEGARGQVRGISHGAGAQRLRRRLHGPSDVFDFARVGPHPGRTGDRAIRSTAWRSIRRDVTSGWKRPRASSIGHRIGIVARGRARVGDRGAQSCA